VCRVIREKKNKKKRKKKQNMCALCLNLDGLEMGIEIQSTQISLILEKTSSDGNSTNMIYTVHHCISLIDACLGGSIA
jgi:hypothetical protein